MAGLTQDQLLALAVKVGLRDACVLVALEGVEESLEGFFRRVSRSGGRGWLGGVEGRFEGAFNGL